MKPLADPSGTLGMFLGHCAHTVLIVGILPGEDRIAFQDPYQAGNKQSLLAKGQNSVGIRAIKIDRHTWSITKQEFIDSVLSFMTARISYDYYTNRMVAEI